MSPQTGRSTPARPTLASVLAAFFNSRPNTWIDGRELAGIAGAYAWRTRTSELRRSPYSFNIENRQRKVTTTDGSPITISEYRLVILGGLDEVV